MLSNANLTVKPPGPKLPPGNCDAIRPLPQKLWCNSTPAAISHAWAFERIGYGQKLHVTTRSILHFSERTNTKK